MLMLITDGFSYSLLLLVCFPFAANAERTVVIPERVHLDRIHFLQTKESISSKGRRLRSVPLHPTEVQDMAGTLVIRLPTPPGLDLGSDLYLKLQRNMDFLAPSFSVEEIGKNQSSHRLDVGRLCFYTGHVLNRSFDSLAVLSACGGLVLVCHHSPLWAIFWGCGWLDSLCLDKTAKGE